MSGITSVGFIGVGHLGAPMAQCLLEHGVHVAAVDRNASALEALSAVGAERANSAAELADTVETIFLCLPTPAAVADVVLGKRGIACGSRVRTVVDFSTTGPEVATRISQKLHASTIDYVECPVTGGVARARRGDLTLLACGPEAAIARANSVLGLLGRVYNLGSTPGAAQMMKLVNNALSATAFALTAEVVIAGAKFGLDAATMIEVLNAGSGRNSATEDKFPEQILNGRYQVGFTFELVLKDLELFMAKAARLGAPTPITEASLKAWRVASEHMGPERDCSNVFRSAARAANHEVD